MEINAKAVSDFLERHAVEESIVIKRHGKPHAVMIPYEIFQAMRKESRKAILVEDLTEEDMKHITNS
jgi:PHD/YefM family antitoxin component YafN of YafNO toxin-antitoxin module